MKLTIVARQSPLSRLQVKEVFGELKLYYPDLEFDVTWVETVGDRDQSTSLRDMGKTNFFSLEVDTLILNSSCRVAIHSAKDLPDPLPQGLTVAALTVGVNPTDSLVIRKDATLESLPGNAVIATSSLRREEMVKALRSDLTFCDIRGTIEKRLSKLHNLEVDGVVIAEAALIRLGLTHLNRIHLPGNTVEGQGQLAVVARSNDTEMLDFLNVIDSRERIPK